MQIYGNIWTPDKELYYRSSNKMSVRYDYIIHKSYSSLDWSKMSSEEKDEVRKHSTIKETIESYSYLGFGNIQLKYGYVWSDSSGREKVLSIDNNKLDFGDILFSTDLDYLKDISSLE